MLNHEQLLAAHKDRTERVASRVEWFYKRGEPFRIYHGGTNSTRRRKHDPSKVIDTSGFPNILSIDQTRRTAIVEPNISMEQLVDATLPLGLVPLVVMEFPAITVGGGFSGSSGESSSFRHGFFENTINRIEIVLGDGKVVHASPTENADLYYGASGSFGTLGVVTELEVQLMDAKPFVDLEYWTVSSAADAVTVTESYTADDKIQYLDGIMFSKDNGVIMAGRMVDGEESRSSQQYRRPWDPWFFIRAKEINANSNQGFKELIPLKDYLFRYDRGAFWAGYYCFEYFLTPFNRFTRWALDDLLHTNVMYKALHKSGLGNEYIVQDIGFPYETAPAFIEYLDQHFKQYPLWLCPLRAKKAHIALSPLLPPYTTPEGTNQNDTETENEELRLLNIGVWGPGPRHTPTFITANREIEAQTRALGGLKCLYAHAYYTAEEFWSIYDKARYDGLRAKYNAQLMPSVFEKVSVNDDGDARGAGVVREYFKTFWPVRGLYGAFHVLLHRGELGLRVSPVHVFLFLPFFAALVAWNLVVRVVVFLFSACLRVTAGGEVKRRRR
ncbi:hypothetical protein BDV97DRAFT_343011 [Delphinella strobiligena]|nr:hypothetical protein BDV97DRAFT_343011 [Delphinella strobiligena]